MLSKQIGPSVVLTMTGTAQTVTPSSFASQNFSIPKVVRIATNSQPAFVSFNTTATTTTSILIPANSAEHFKLENSTLLLSTGTATAIPAFVPTYMNSTGTVSILQAGSGGLISITPVA